jgi:hypothetical protein
MVNEGVEQKLAKLQHELERTQAANAILNIMGTLQCLHTAGRDSEIGTLFAKRPDTRVYFGELGSFEGPDAPNRAGAGMAGMPKVGMMPLHLMVNPVIEVAGDGQTAQAVFVASGIVASRDRQTGGPRCMWEWNRYGDDFIKEDGKWWLWHHHVYPLFQVGWDDKWADQFAPKKGPGMQMPFKPDYPPTPEDVFYSPDIELPFIPIPKPYQTWADVEPY